MYPEYPYQNGVIWKSPTGLKAVFQVLPGNKFILLCHSCAEHGGTCLNVITDPDRSGKWLYTYDEILDRLIGWIPLPRWILIFQHPQERI